MSTALSPGGYVRQGARSTTTPRAVNVQVAVRCRPLNARERAAGERPVLTCDANSREVVCAPATVQPGSTTLGKKTYTYDHVFGPDTSQADVYEGVVEPIVDEVLQGYNCTVFAYGQTGTGKTHTMEGRRDDDVLCMAERRLPENAGIIPRSVKQIFDYLRSITDEHTVRVSHLELYNEQLTDLLGPDPDETALPEATLRVYDDVAKGTFVQGLDEVLVQSEEEIFAVLDKSATKRRTAETLMNKYSSRSHSVFTITIHIKESTPDGADLLKVGKLNLVDLAGSENVGRSGAVRGRAREAGNINQSLLTLGRVITALVEKHPHVPYRDSKLTRLLQESLGGRNKTCIIATVTPASNSTEETASTLDYAHRAKSIKNRPTVNQMIAKNVLLKEYTEEIAKIKRELDASRSKNGIYLPPEEYERLLATSKHQKQWITQLEGRTEDFEKHNTVLKEKLGRTQDALARTLNDLDETKRTLKETEQSLAETRHTLAVTTQQRDESIHLVHSHVQSEQQLLSEGRELTSTVQGAVCDVEQLHSRVDARVEAEKANIASLQGVQRSVADSLTEANSAVEAFRENQSSRLENCRGKCRAASEQLARNITRASTDLRAAHVELGNLQMSQMSEASKAEAELAGFADESRSALQALAGERERIGIEIARTIEVALQKVQQSISSIEEGLQAVTSTSTTAFDSHVAQLEAFAASQESLIRQAHDKLQEKLQVQAAVVNTGQKDLAEAVESHNEELSKARQSALSEITNILSKFVDVGEKAGAKMVANNRQHCDVLHATAKDIESEIALSVRMHSEESRLARVQASTAAEKASERIRTHVASTSAVAADMHGAVQNHIVATKKNLDEISTTHDQEQTTLCDVFSRNALSRSDRETMLRDAQRAQEKFMDENISAAGEFLEESTTAVQRDTEHVCRELQEATTGASSFANQLSASLSSGVGDVVGGMSLATDDHAASAPARRRWEYPQTLTQTAPHDELVAEFRTKQGYGPAPVSLATNNVAGTVQNTGADADELPLENGERAQSTLPRAPSEDGHNHEIGSQAGSFRDDVSSMQGSEASEAAGDVPDVPASAAGPRQVERARPHVKADVVDDVLRDRTNVPNVTSRRPPTKTVPGAEPTIKRSGLRPMTRRPTRTVRTTRRAA